MTATYREKTTVLCGIRITVRDGGSTHVYENHVAVEAEFPDLIEEELRARVGFLRYHNAWPGIFVDWEWISYLPRTGTRTFTGREKFH